MATERYRYKCACKKDPMSGSLNTGSNVLARDRALEILDQVWSATHKEPGCLPPSKARTITPWGKKKGAA